MLSCRLIRKRGSRRTDLTNVQPADRADLVVLLYLDPDRMPLYLDLVLTSLSEAARKSLRAMNRFSYEYQSDLARTYFYGGEAAMLVKLLRLKFGPLPDAVTARVRSASPDELNAWVERVLSASSVDEVLG
jgi:hypothetical protein